MQSIWISQCRSHTIPFITRFTASPVTHLPTYLWALFMLEKLFPSLSRHAHSSDYHRWVPFCQLLYAKLRRRGYGDAFLRSVFANVTSGDRICLLSPCEKPASEFDLQCVWSCANAVGIRKLFPSCDLNLAAIDSECFPPNSAKLLKALNSSQRKLECDEQGPMTDLRQLLWGHPN